MKKLSLPLIIILVLCILGLFREDLSSTLSSLVLPILFIVVVLLLFNFLPWSKQKKSSKNRSGLSEEQRYKEAVRKQREKIKKQQTTSTSKTLPFKVIEGGKDDNDSPRYH